MLNTKGNTMKKLVSILLSAVFALSCALMLVSCSTEPKDDIDLTKVIASVGDRKITLGEYKTMFDMYIKMWASYGYDPTSDEESMNEFRNMIMDLLVSNMVVLYHGEKDGLFELNDEQQAELDAMIKEEIDGLHEYYQDIVSSEENVEDTDKRIEELILEEAAYYGLTDIKTVEEYEEYLKTSIRESYYNDIVKAEATKDIAASDDEVRAWFDDGVKELKEKYNDDPGSYKDDKEYYEMYGGDPVVYTPEGYFRMMHILIAPEGTISEEYTALKGQLDALITEYGKLAFEDARSDEPKNTERLAEIIAEYNEKEVKANELSEEFNKEAKKKIELAYKELQEGKAFSEVMKEYTEDEDFISFADYMEKGMLISRNESYVDWSDKVKEEFFKLKQGEYSEVFFDTDGYHIVYFVSVEEPGEADFDKYKDVIAENIKKSNADEEWEKIKKEWCSAEEVMIDYEAIKAINKSDAAAA